MDHDSKGTDGRGIHKVGDVALVTTSNLHLSPSPNTICIYSSCADERGHYPSKCVVEQILVLGLKKKPSSVSTHSSGKETVHSYLSYRSVCSKEMNCPKTGVICLV
jgi:hypothetical protein